MNWKGRGKNRSWPIRSTVPVSASHRPNIGRNNKQPAVGLRDFLGPCIQSQDLKLSWMNRAFLAEQDPVADLLSGY
jgi:hypothetical protein